MVRMIAADIVAEVCSAYVLRGEYLELFATEGLRPSAVHRTRLRIGEGLVGLIAAHGGVVNLPEAQSHPDFAYRPETGEEIYHSFLGVPIVHGGRVTGVLVVQNRTQRHYSEEEVEALQIVGTVFAEMFASGGLADTAAFPSDLGRVGRPERLEGLRLVEGVALGDAVLHQLRIEVSRLVAEDPDAEAARLEDAIGGLRASMDELLLLPEVADGEHREVLEAYRMFAHDAGWRRRMSEAVRTGLSAEAAVRRVQEETRLRMVHVSDPYLKERLHDLDALADRLLVHLTGRALMHDPATLPAEFILVARSLGPAELLDYDRSRLRGVVVEEGSPTSHVAIVARALDIPMVGRVETAMSRINPGRPGGGGRRPRPDLRAPGRGRRAGVRALARHARRAAPGVRGAARRAGGDPGRHAHRAAPERRVPDRSGGVGDHQRRRHRPVSDRARVHGARPLPRRRGADRALRQGARAGRRQAGGVPHARRRQRQAPAVLDLSARANPAMGWRSLRMTLDRPVVLRTQLRALIRSARGGRLDVMFPMVAEVAEFAAARSSWTWSWRAPRPGEPLPSEVRVGVMLEVPSLLWQLRALLPRIDFLSIGTNDLLQFLFACDRGNPELIDRYDVLSPPVLSFIRELVERCREAGVALSICGEMAARPLEAMVLLGLGVRDLSMTPTDIGPVKAMLRSLRCGQLAGYLSQLCDLSDHSLRDRLRHYALDHGIPLHI